MDRSPTSSFADIDAALAGHAWVFSERELLKLLEAPLAQLKSRPDEERLAFVCEALDRLPTAESFQLQIAFKGIVSSMLRAGVRLSSLEAVRLVQLVSRRKVVFPFKAVLSAVEPVPRTPALRDALVQLRSIIDEWLGGPAMRELHERIDGLLHGVKEEPLSRSPHGASRYSRKSTFPASNLNGALSSSMRGRSHKAPLHASGRAKR